MSNLWKNETNRFRPTGDKHDLDCLICTSLKKGTGRQKYNMNIFYTELTNEDIQNEQNEDQNDILSIFYDFMFNS